MFTSFGHFTRYRPDFDPEHYGGSTPIFLRNEVGQDFYELRATLHESNGPVFIRSNYDAFFTVSAGVVSVVSKSPADPTRVFPQDVAFWGYVGADAASIAPGMLFDGQTFSPAPPPPYVPITIPADVLFDRLTEDEFDTLDDSVRTGETTRVYRQWVAAREFVEGSTLWSVLVTHLNEIVSETRLAELLARPTGAAMADEIEVVGA